jgi:hypothetical protein
MRRLTEKEKAAVERVDQLPRGAAVGIRLAALYSGTSERTWRDKPPIRTFKITPHKRAANVGELRDLTSGKLTPDAAIEPRNLAAAADKACEAWRDASPSQDVPSAGSTTFGVLTNGDRTSLQGALPGPLAFPDAS